MHLFVYEHLTGGGSGSSLPRSLAREGWAMLRALLEDLVQIPGVSVTTIIDDRFAAMMPPRLEERVQLVKVHDREGAREHFDRLAGSCDASLIVAPETENVLVDLTERAQGKGGRVLGSSAGAIRRASDKLGLARLLAEKGIPCVPSAIYVRDSTPASRPPWVVKLRLGAGSTDTYLVTDPAASIAIDGEAVLTPHVPGLAASILVIAGEREVHPLPPGEQHLTSDGRFRYLGGTLPLSSQLRPRAITLARRAVGAVPGLAGFVGVDLILADDPGGNAIDTVVEINPRLTTSYVGLRALTRENLAQRWLEVMLGRPTRAIEWREGRVRFSAGGEVRVLDPASSSFSPGAV